MLRTKATRVGTAVALVGILLTGCSSGTPDLPTCADVECIGVINGAAYEIVLPDEWNGTLLLYSHGYRSAFPAPPDFAPIDSTAEPAPGWASGDREVGDALLARGYALAGSAYSANGWAVVEGVAAGVDVISFFSDSIAEPSRVLAWGDSLGGLVTANLAEIPDLLDGAAPMCGVLAGPVLNFDLAADVTLAAQLTVLPDLPLSLPGGYEDSVRALEPALRTLLDIAEDPADPRAGVLLAIGAMAQAPDQTRSFDGATPSSRLSAVIEGIVTAISFGTLARYEFDQRVGEPSISSDPSVYLARIDPEELAGIEKEFPGTTVALEESWQGADPLMATDAARAAAAELGTVTGDLKVPVLTLHTAADSLVIVANQSVYRDQVIAAGAGDQLVTGITLAPATYPQDPGAPYGAGHCNFPSQTRLGVISALDSWLDSGTPPTGDALAEFLGAQSGLDPGFELPRWPGRP